MRQQVTHDKIVAMARRAINDHGSRRLTKSGKVMVSSTFPVSYVEVTLNPDQLSGLFAEGPFPKDCDGVPLIFAEKPLKGPQWDASAMCKYHRDGKVRGSIGNICRMPS